MVEIYHIKLWKQFRDMIELVVDSNYNCFSPDLKYSLKKYKTNLNDSKWYVNIDGNKVFQSYLTPILG